MEQTIGKRIMENRKRLGLTQDQLAEQLGVTAQAVSKWENDQSCPDIGLLALLADIFGITTDVLLGRESREKVHYAEVVQEQPREEESDLSAKLGNFEFRWDAGKKSALGLAIFVLAFGGLYLASQLLSWEHSFWDLLWPTALFVFGVFGLYPKFSFVHLGCTLIGGFFLTKLFVDIPVTWDSGVFWAVLIVLLGLSLLADALRRPKKPTVKVNVDNDHKQASYEYNSDTDHFEMEGNFGSFHQLVELQTLRSGSIDVNFGQYTVELCDTMVIAPGCSVEAECNFGQLTILVPKRIAVKSMTASAFGGVEVQGTPDAQPQAELLLEASANFGSIIVRYI